MAGVLASAKSPDLTMSLSQKMSQQHLQPRRSPPRDVNLRPGHKKQKLSHSPDDAAANVSPAAAQLKSQGSGSDQSASRWFDRVNKHVPQSVQANTEYYDEPPFFMSNQTNYLPNTFAPSEGSRMFGVQSRLDSENEELRGVIDDLTIENKRLKNILRTNQKSQRGSPSTDGQDKLFEVRMHGLSSDKRRELEFLLKNFATSVHTSAPSISGSTAGSGVSSNSVTANNKSKTDSGYASNSNSGQPSMLGAINTRGMPGISRSTREKNIKSYLHDIPDTLLPRQQPIIMSDRSRMALVVRRLEQLFTGKKAAPGEHSQPLQQQEVSQMAARADAKNSRKRKIEGTREAHILPPDTKVNLDIIESGPEKRKHPETKTFESDASISEALSSSISRPGSPDQRPTRPLDLDIHRAQVAAENIQYIRHLGLSSPRLDTDDSNGSWIYLNLLSNMAQLHTINVTPEFIRRAIKKLSTQFELSKDGHKIRWVGGSEGTVFSKEEEKALEAADKDHNSPDGSNEESGTGGSSKRSKTDSNSNPVVSNSTLSEDKTSGLQTSRASRQHISTGATSNLLSSQQTKLTKSVSAFDYKPIVYRDRPRDTLVEESYLQDSESSPDNSSRDSSGLAHALSRSNLNQQRNADEGLITFYNNPFFCSDYSGDKMPNNMLPPRPVSPALIVGGPPGDDWDEHSSRLADACYFTPQFGPPPFRSHKDEKLPELVFAPLSSTKQEEIRPKEFIVSGLGGITPDDNFAIDVDVHMVRLPANHRAPPITTIPLTETRVKAGFTHKRGACHKIQLLPSRLPPPSYIFFTSSSSSGNQVDDDDDDISEESSESSSSAENIEPAPPAFLQLWETEDSGMVGLDDIDDQDDSSIDMLAAARAVNPMQIAEQERQYLINQPGGRAIAGSLAATVGASRSTTSIGEDVKSDLPEAVSQDGEDDDDDDDDDDESTDSDMDMDDE